MADFLRAEYLFFLNGRQSVSGVVVWVSDVLVWLFAGRGTWECFDGACEIPSLALGDSCSALGGLVPGRSGKRPYLAYSVGLRSIRLFFYPLNVVHHTLLR
jgi:hypothetical protein